MNAAHFKPASFLSSKSNAPAALSTSTIGHLCWNSWTRWAECFYFVFCFFHEPKKNHEPVIRSLLCCSSFSLSNIHTWTSTPHTPPTQVASWYNVVVFTASLQQYGNPVIDALDRGRGIVKGRYFREVRICLFCLFVCLFVCFVCLFVLFVCLLCCVLVCILPWRCLCRFAPYFFCLFVFVLFCFNFFIFFFFLLGFPSHTSLFFKVLPTRGKHVC